MLDSFGEWIPKTLSVVDSENGVSWSTFKDTFIPSSPNWVKDDKKHDRPSRQEGKMKAKTVQQAQVTILSEL